MSALSDADRQRLSAALAEASRGAVEADGAAALAEAQASRQAAELEALVDSAQKLALRGRDLRAGVQELRDTLERGRLATLNTALEGTRLAEPIGKVLVALTDELRSLLARSVDVLDEHAGRVAELEREREKWVLTLGPLSDAARAVALEVARALHCQRAESAALSALSDDLRRLLGVDPELGGLVARATREAEELKLTLRSLEERGAKVEAERLLADLQTTAKAPGSGS